MTSTLLRDNAVGNEAYALNEKGRSRVRDADPVIEFICFLMDRWLILLAASVICVGLSVYIYVRTTPLYEAKTVVSDSDPSLPSAYIGQAQTSAGLSLNGLLGAEKSITVAQITSIDTAKKFAVSSGIINDPFVKFAIEKRKFSYDVPKEELAARFLVNNVVSARKDSKTGLIEVSFRWPDPSRSAELLEEYINSVDGEIKENYLKSSSNAVDFLEKSIANNRKQEFNSAIVGHYQKALQPLIFGDAPGRFAIRTIDPATIPLDSTRPHVAVYIFAGLLAGAFFGIAAALVARLAKKLVAGYGLSKH